MSNAAPESSAAGTETQLDAGTYEILQSRLRSQAEELQGRLQQLNDARKQVFGAIETALTGTERIATVHNCVPRDMVSIGQWFLFGYNVHLGLKSEMELSDVFSVYEFSDNTFHPRTIDAIDDERFLKDFKDVYRYYKEATFSRFSQRGPFFYMVFQVGKSPSDIKTFKWHVSDEALEYVDNRSDHEVRLPPQHEFEWTRVTRDQHRMGAHPHITIEDEVFVETIGGDLTIKVENNTDSGAGIYSESVEYPDQTLDDAHIEYARLGNVIVLRIRPYQESDDRYFVFNIKLQRVIRLDSIASSCILLPDDQGLIFPNGYYLQTGEYKTFDHDRTGMAFRRRIVAANGEDYLFVFHNLLTGEYILLNYNLIRQEVDTPLICHGFTLFEGGELICFRAQEEPQRHHAIQIWQTPYAAEELGVQADTSSYLYKIGNRDIVRGMAECHEVVTLAQRDDPYASLFMDLVKKTSDVIDAYFWLDRDEAFHLNDTLAAIHETANAAVGEFEKVTRVRRNTEEETLRVETAARDLIASVHRRRFDQLDGFVSSLSELRTMRGEVISLRELRYVDEELIDSLEVEVSENSERIAHRCVQFLLRPDSLAAYQGRIQELQQRIPQTERAAEARDLGEEIDQTASELEMLIDIVGNLKIDDATQRTSIIDHISGIFATINAARAELKRRLRELLSEEGVAEFNSQLKLLNQSVVNYLDLAESPERCDEFLTKLMVQIEELEGRFAEFDEFVLQLTEKREEVYNTFENRKLSLLEKRNKRAAALQQAADRILKGIRSRVEGFDSINEINGYFASDLMIEKVRNIIEELESLDDSVKVDEIQSGLKTIREDAVRQLKDRKELFVDGQNIIRFGAHQFSVNVQPLDLTTVIRDHRPYLHLTGTDFFEEIHEAILEESQACWSQEVVSENDDVYRGEYLAFRMLHDWEKDAASGRPSLSEASHLEVEELIPYVTRFMGPRYEEGYTKGVHDEDAGRILFHLLRINANIGLLRYAPRARAAAVTFWTSFCDRESRARWEARCRGFGQVAEAFPNAFETSDYRSHLQHLIRVFCQETELFPESVAESAGAYLFDELCHRSEFVISQIAARVVDEFQVQLRSAGFAEAFEESKRKLQESPSARFDLMRDWSNAFIRHRGNDVELDYVDEVAVLLDRNEVDHRLIVHADPIREIPGLRGSHPRLQSGDYRLNYNEFVQRLSDFESQTIPQFRSYVEAKKNVLDQAREDMRLDEFRPRVLTSFVRNQLLDKVYLPVIGDNLAKQIGSAGEQKRTDRMGLLLLVSPPGYGKTTLMEYIANRLGIIFMKINGPAIGHGVTSLDPAAADNSGAREELQKLNMAFEMGDNVMIYLDDIQHCHPEFLQKFISLCDAQRKIEGVYKGRPRTYDFRGRKVAVVMAGNPYTESGEKFQIPDMLSNRADIYNLGEMAGEHTEAFDASYLENCLTSNPVLNKLASRSQADVRAVIRLAGQPGATGIEFEGNYAPEELEEMVATMRKLMRVRDVILQVNRQYIRSAAQSDDYRTEPPFKLQGSYRNMNRIAEKVVSVMNERELEELIVANYENDAQTLTSDMEANLLKFKELMGNLSEVEQQRWDEIKSTFRRNNRLRGIGAEDRVGQVVAELSEFNAGLEALKEQLGHGIDSLANRELRVSLPESLAQAPGETADQFVELVNPIAAGLAAIQTAIAELQLSARSTSPVDTAPTQSDQVASPTDPQSTVKPVDQSIAELDAGRNRVTIVNRLPRSFISVVENQFALMNQWLKAMHDRQIVHSTEADELKETMEQCLESYEHLLARFKKSRSPES